MLKDIACSIFNESYLMLEDLMLTDVDFFIKQRMVTIIELGRYVIIKFSTVALFNKGVMIGGKPYVSCIGKDFDEKSCTGYYIFFLGREYQICNTTFK
jgi:hypothetical protein